ncbi:MAG: MoxR family ATPase [Acidimicrobiia bacterium]|nr:MoxR family ATPase [Acidimicrobiia bacterium]
MALPPDPAVPDGSPPWGGSDPAAPPPPPPPHGSALPGGAAPGGAVPGAAPAAGPLPPPAPAADDGRDDVRGPILELRDEVGKVVVGQDGTLSGLVAALLVRGHVLLEGVPGTAKTLLVKAIAAALDLDFARVQFTPDLMPSDVVGQVIFESQEGSFRFREGPVFTNLLLADEINRTPPKTQAALLESMEERQVSVEGITHPLPDPFIVVATQNPVEYEGTYPLPEAQLDRFLFKLHVGYPTAEQEQEVLARHHAGLNPHDVSGAGVRPVASPAELAAARRQVDAIGVEPRVLAYMVALVRATREAPSVALGVSPRGAAALLHASKAWAWLAGRAFVTPDEVKAVARPTLRHRIALRPELELEGATTDGVLDTLLATVPVPR